MANVDPETNFDFLRMHVETFNELLTLLKPHISKQTAVRRPIPAHTRLEICLRYLASRDHLSSLTYAFRVAQNTISKIIAETCQAIWDVLAERDFPALTEEMWQHKAADFEEIRNYPNCIGCIDGKHVTVQAPPNSGSTYYNYKGQHSIVLLAITDANGLFTIVDIGAESRRRDGGILMHSDVGRALRDPELNLPAPRLLEVNGPLLPYILLGDEAFALTNYMIDHIHEDLKAFERRLTEVISSLQPATLRWRFLLCIVSICTAIGAWYWLTDPNTSAVPFTQSLWNHPFFTLASFLLVILFMMGIHRRVIAPSIITQRVRNVLGDFNMSCDDTGKLILKPTRPTHLHET